VQPLSGGVGGGTGGGCGDCDGEYPLTATALTFGVVPLNTYVRFCTPGAYTCEASSAASSCGSGEDGTTSPHSAAAVLILIRVETSLRTRKVLGSLNTIWSKRAQQVQPVPQEVDDDRARFRHRLLHWYSATAMLRIYSLGFWTEEGDSNARPSEDHS
jgi:hypothetical protein